MGSNGLGEIALVGVAPAIANAVFYAAGKHIIFLPIRPDELLEVAWDMLDVTDHSWVKSKWDQLVSG